MAFENRSNTSLGIEADSGSVVLKCTLRLLNVLKYARSTGNQDLAQQAHMDLLRIKSAMATNNHKQPETNGVYIDIPNFDSQMLSSMTDAQIRYWVIELNRQKQQGNDLWHAYSNRLLATEFYNRFPVTSEVA